ncbi:unnamed protein product [Linum trigynum]|uniref:Pollen Ole e 1 allergen and extensin family protein n=2 Tax=Linum trigynum TaxID=586398 RepID=A0AAV2F329_9ROSI
MAAKMAYRLITSLFFFFFFFFTFTFTTLSHTSEARHFPQNPTKAVVVGTVYCDTCFNNRFSKPTHFISGASVVVECKDGRFRREVKTNQLGEFSVELPFTVNREVKKIKRCSVKLLTSSDPYCAVASTATSSSLHLRSRNNKLGSDSRIYSAGYFTFKPSHQPTLCSQNPTTTSAGSNEQKDLSGFPAVPSPGGGGDDDEPTLPPPVNTNPNGGVPPPEMNQNRLPPLPLLPRLPPLPTLPRLPYLPPWPAKSFNKHEKPTLRQGEGDELSDQKSGRPGQPQGLLFPPILPPNPLQPPSPPSLPLPPNPLEPPSLVPPILPPNPLQPPPAPFLPIPPIPGLTPSPPPPPVLPFPFPPPLLPLPPGFPGIPPAAHAAHKSKSNPPSTIDP